LTAGLSPTPFYQVYDLEMARDSLSYGISQFISNMYILNSLITRNWEVFKDAVSAPDLAGDGAQHHSHGDHRPHDPLQHAGGIEAGLYPHGARQGPAGKFGCP
jgi:hypothetical protein